MLPFYSLVIDFILTLAIFDLDNTLIAGDSDHLWGEFLVQNQFVDPTTYQAMNDQFYEDYKRGQLDIIAYQEFALTPLAQYNQTQLNDMHALFMQTKIMPIMLTKAKALITKHQQLGHCLLIITATNHFVTAPIAKALGFEHIIATKGEIVDGHYTGKIDGTPSFAEGKITRLNEWLSKQSQSMEHSYFYSDSHNDLPLLRIVDNPIAVNPDERLRETAKQLHWPILDLR